MQSRRDLSIRRGNQFLSRRALLRLAASATAGVAVTACAPQQTATRSNERSAPTPVVSQPLSPYTFVEKQVPKPLTSDPVDKLMLPRPSKPPTVHDGRLQVEMWDMGPGAPEAFQQLFNVFSATRPGKRISLTMRPFDEHHRALASEAAAGVTADVVAIDGLHFPAVVEQQDILRPLNDRVGELDRRDFFPIWLDQTVYDEQWYGFLLQTTTYLPIVNLDAFSRAGVAVPDLDNWTWNDFVAAAQRLTVDKQGRTPHNPSFDAREIVQFGTKLSLADHTDLAMGLAASGDGLFDGRRDRTRLHTRLEAPEFVAATEAVLSVSLTDHAAPTLVDALRLAPDAFRAGQVAIGWIWSDMLATSLTVPNYFPFKVASAMFPRWQQRRPGVVNAGVLAMGRDARGRDEAWELLRWMGTSQEFVLGTNGTTGMPYSHSLAKRTRELWPSPLKDLAQRHIETTRIGRPRPFGAEGVQVRDEILRPLRQKLQLGVMDVPSAWGEGAQRIDSVLAMQARKTRS